MKGSGLFLAVLLAMPLAQGLGIGPVQFYTVHEPGKAETLRLTIINSDSRDMAVRIEARGELAPWLDLPRVVELKGTKREHSVEFVFRHPAEFAPGPHYADIVVTETARDSDAMVEALESHVSRLWLQAPHTEDYAQARLDVQPDSKGAGVAVSVYNFGQDAISASASITLNGPQEAQLDLGPEQIAPMSEGYLQGWAELAIGRYTADALVSYSGKEIRLNKSFQVGSRTVEIIRVEQAFQDGIVKISALLRNAWFEPQQAYGKIFVAADTIVTETFEISEEKAITAYWDAEGMEPGNYSAVLRIYAGETTTHEFTIIVPPEKAAPAGPGVAALVLLLVAALLAGMAIYLKRRKTI